MHVLNSTEQSEAYLKDGFNGVMVGSARSWMLSAAGGAHPPQDLRDSPPKITSSDDVLEALAAGDIDVAAAKATMAKLY